MQIQKGKVFTPIFEIPCKSTSVLAPASRIHHFILHPECGQEIAGYDAAFHGYADQKRFESCHSTAFFFLDTKAETEAIAPHVYPILDGLQGENDAYLLYL